jgi:TPP-dependent pyruvate/acetoin dehydrogenase alpha subunit
MDTITKEVSDAVAQAETFGEPDRESLITDVYADVPEHLREQLRDLD